MGNRLSRILAFNRTPPIQETYEKWNGTLRTQHLQKRLEKATTNPQRKEIENEMTDATKSTNIIQFSSKKRTPEGNYGRTTGDDQLIK